MKRNHVFAVIVFVISSVFMYCDTANKNQEPPIKAGSVIFIHPDGSAASMWAALRMVEAGPDGMLHWDKMEQMGLYRGHLTNSLVSSSNGAATVHAFGRKVPYHTYGIHPGRPVRSLSGKPFSIMTEAGEAGISRALINSGHLCEPGTGAFVANSAKRSATDTITRQIIESGVEIILAGGEALLLPEGVTGFHGLPGVRKDGENLIEYAENLGYTVVYTSEQMEAVPDETERVLGVFAAMHTFNDQSEEELLRKNLPLYVETAPSVADMTAFALKMLHRKGQPFFIVVEEEGSDNFANDNNAVGTFEALRRADRAIGTVLNYIEQNPETMLLTAADSDAGGMKILSVRDSEDFEKPLPPVTGTGAPLDGVQGTRSHPFVTKPDKFGNELGFGIAWTHSGDLEGGVVAKAHGLNAGLLPNNVDNTDIYRMMYATLFGQWLW